MFSNFKSLFEALEKMIIVDSPSYGNRLLPYLIVATVLLGCNSGSAASVTQSSTTAISCSAIGIESIQQCIITSSGNVAPLYGLNNMPYALCSQTLCSIDSESATVASCFCPIINESGWQSASLSPSKYVSAQPTWSLSDSLQSVQSDYSLANYPPVPQQCTFTTPHKWASCFGVRCSVSSDGKSADCKCPINSSYSFLFEMPTSACGTSGNQIWSAAAVDGSGYNDMLLIYETLYPAAPVLQSAK